MNCTTMTTFLGTHASGSMGTPATNNPFTNNPDLPPTTLLRTNYEPHGEPISEEATQISESQILEVVFSFLLFF